MNHTNGRNLLYNYVLDINKIHKIKVLFNDKLSKIS